MSDNVIFFGWNRSIPGREQMSGTEFQSFTAYLVGLQQEGAIASFEVVLLSPHGGDLNGFFLIRGGADQLDALQASEAWMGYLTRAGLHLEGAGEIRGVTGNMVVEWMSRWMQAIPN
jgi:hypothetical protein